MNDVGGTYVLLGSLVGPDRGSAIWQKRLEAYATGFRKLLRPSKWWAGTPPYLAPVGGLPNLISYSEEDSAMAVLCARPLNNSLACLRR